MKFEQALVRLKHGSRVTNKNWNGKDAYLEMQVPDTNSKMNSPYIYIKTVNNKLVPWLASQDDLFSEGWEIVPQDQEIKLALPKTRLECNNLSCKYCYMNEFRYQEKGSSMICSYRRMLDAYFTER